MSAFVHLANSLSWFLRAFAGASRSDHISRDLTVVAIAMAGLYAKDRLKASLRPLHGVLHGETEEFIVEQHLDVQELVMGQRLIRRGSHPNASLMNEGRPTASMMKRAGQIERRRRKFHAVLFRRGSARPMRKSSLRVTFLKAVAEIFERLLDRVRNVSRGLDLWIARVGVK